MEIARDLFCSDIYKKIENPNKISLVWDFRDFSEALCKSVIRKHCISDAIPLANFPVIRKASPRFLLPDSGWNKGQRRKRERERQPWLIHIVLWSGNRENVFYSQTHTHNVPEEPRSSFRVPEWCDVFWGAASHGVWSLKYILKR